jgi:hypothetical protein
VKSLRELHIWLDRGKCRCTPVVHPVHKSIRRKKTLQANPNIRFMIMIGSDWGLDDIYGEF